MKEFLRCLLLPVNSKTLLVPYSAVAEITPFEPPKPLEASSHWLLGELEWRGVKIPLLSIEEMINLDKPREEEKLKNQTHLHIAVMNRMSESASLDFIGWVLQSMPVMRRFKRVDIKSVSPMKEPYLMEASVREQSVFIPNIKWIEDAAAKQFKISPKT